MSKTYSNNIQNISADSMWYKLQSKYKDKN